VFALAVVGAIALVGVILGLFFRLGRRPNRLFAKAPARLDDEDAFLLALAGVINSPCYRGGRVEVLNNGDEFYPAILDAIRGARQSVTFFTYIFEDGKIGREVLGALTDRARAGVSVRLLLDGFGGKDADQELIDVLEAAGGVVHRYRPFHLGKLTRFHKRNHRRAIVIDGRIGFTGGASVGDKWLGNADHPDNWRDLMFRMSGPLAFSVQAAFGETWSNTHGEILTGPRFFPAESAPDEIVGGEAPNGSAHHAICRHVNLISSPASEAHPIRKIFWLSFAAATERLYLTTSYFVPDGHIRAVLIERARAGVDVRVLVPNRHTDAKPVWWASRSYYDELLSGGVRIFQFQPTFLHSKALVVDGRWSVIGSANMDVRSKELNEENVLGILDHGLGERLERVFLDDLAQSREIVLDEWRKRGLHHRLLERFFVLFAEQY